MTTLTSHAIFKFRFPAIRIPQLPRMRLGGIFTTITESYRRAMSMAYVEPFHQGEVPSAMWAHPASFQAFDDSLEGRDPCW